MVTLPLIMEHRIPQVADVGDFPTRASRCWSGIVASACGNGLRLRLRGLRFLNWRASSECGSIDESHFNFSQPECNTRPRGRDNLLRGVAFLCVVSTPNPPRANQARPEKPTPT